MIDSFANDRPGPTFEVRVTRVSAGEDAPARTERRFDRVATEEPLEIRLRAGEERRTVAITMRTPGNDFELAAGFLYGEGVIGGYDDVRAISFCVDVDDDQRYNVLNVDLAAPALPVVETLERHFLTTSACGVCGRAKIDDLVARGLTPVSSELHFDAAMLATFPDRLREGQRLFAQTGGLHAAGLIDERGALAVAREDVGRHNAVDKVIGWALLQRRLPLERCALVVSGRTSYEILQKAVAARIPIVCAVSAPSSLAVELARAFGLTLAGFVRGGRFNIYAGEDRIRDIAAVRA